MDKTGVEMGVVIAIPGVALLATWWRYRQLTPIQRSRRMPKNPKLAGFVKHPTSALIFGIVFLVEALIFLVPSLWVGH